MSKVGHGRPVNAQVLIIECPSCHSILYSYSYSYTYSYTPISLLVRRSVAWGAAAEEGMLRGGEDGWGWQGVWGWRGWVGASRRPQNLIHPRHKVAGVSRQEVAGGRLLGFGGRGVRRMGFGRGGKGRAGVGSGVVRKRSGSASRAGGGGPSAVLSAQFGGFRSVAQNLIHPRHEVAGVWFWRSRGGPADRLCLVVGTVRACAGRRFAIHGWASNDNTLFVRIGLWLSTN